MALRGFSVFCLSLVIMGLAGCASRAPAASARPAKDRIDLAGEWRFRLDPEGIGVEKQWFARELPDRIALPGTTDQARKGYPLRTDSMDYAVSVVDAEWPGKPQAARADEAGHLVREWLYIGKAWYQRDVDIPRAWAEKRVHLTLERVLWASEVWIDGRRAGGCDSLATPHRYDLGTLAPGRHRLTVRVDNTMQHPIGILTHAYGPETQSRWNGITGVLELTAVDPVYLAQVRVFPAPDRCSVRVEVTAENATAEGLAGWRTAAMQQ